MELQETHLRGCPQNPWGNAAWVGLASALPRLISSLAASSLGANLPALYSFFKKGSIKFESYITKLEACIPKLSAKGFNSSIKILSLGAGAIDEPCMLPTLVQALGPQIALRMPPRDS